MKLLHSARPSQPTQRTWRFGHFRLLAASVMGVFIAITVSLPAFALGTQSLVVFSQQKGAFPLSVRGTPVPLCVSTRDHAGVRMLAKTFQQDIATVTGTSPALAWDSVPPASAIVLIGTIGHSPIIDSLVHRGLLDVSAVTGKWETFLIQVVRDPLPGVGQALVIAGSDKRGTLFGMFTLSEMIGVSPWYWWADAPVAHHPDLFVLPGHYAEGPPSVKYRGIFLNDEYPDLTRWVAEKYGDAPVSRNPPVPPGVANYGHEFYGRVFELLLRLKANYLWPAMWDNAFNEDDSLNRTLANDYGIVMGTSHQEPMLRAQKEWDRRYLQTVGPWNYATHPDVVQTFWREGIRRNRDLESIITMGLRGADDTPMAPGGPEKNRSLLERIISDQRAMIAEELDPDPTHVPQLWCLYKEVLDFYNAGMRVPDDVTLLWPDDNWGNIRRLPTAEERQRSGGAGIYYHFDYHGGPRSYQWINTNPLPKIWEQMSRAKAYGADRIWIVNVGHLKGYELPMSYFFDLAWNTERWTGTNTLEYTTLWAGREFGPPRARSIAEILSAFTQISGSRKPELLSPSTYSQVNYHEAENVVRSCTRLTQTLQDSVAPLPPDAADAFAELVSFPVYALDKVLRLYDYAGKNALYARQGRAAMANAMADSTRLMFVADTSLMGWYNRTLAGGKWNHFMDQTHLGYTSWKDPDVNSLDAIRLVTIPVPDTAAMGVAVEGSELSWPGPSVPARLPEYNLADNRGQTIEVFNKGAKPFACHVTANKPWIVIPSLSRTVQVQEVFPVMVIPEKLPARGDSGIVTISGAGAEVQVQVVVRGRMPKTAGIPEGFQEFDGVVSMKAEHHSKQTDLPDARWRLIDGYGMATTSAPDAPPRIVPENSPCLQYRMYLLDTGRVTVHGVFGPVLNFMPDRPVRYAVSIDDEPPQTITLVPAHYSAQNGNRDWEQSVIQNSRHSASSHSIRTPGSHTLNLWMVDQGVVLKNIVVDCGGMRTSTLPPPESPSHLTTKP